MKKQLVPLTLLMGAVLVIAGCTDTSSETTVDTTAVPATEEVMEKDGEVMEKDEEAEEESEDGVDVGVEVLDAKETEESADDAEEVVEEEPTSDDDDTADASVYTDGTYTIENTYSSPAGSEEQTVEITLEGDVITAVSYTGHATHPTSSLMQDNFAGGIEAAVVGKSLDEADVTVVAGSSLTSDGFNVALEEVRSQAS